MASSILREVRDGGEHADLSLQAGDERRRIAAGVGLGRARIREIVTMRFAQMPPACGNWSRTDHPRPGPFSRLGAMAIAEGLVLGLCGLIAAAPLAAQEGPRSGSGFFVNAAGWLLTNAHVVDGCAAIEVAGHGAPDSVVLDRHNDLAALELRAASGSPVLVFRARGPRLAESVHALGYPLSDLLSSSVKVTSGTINALAGPGNDSRYTQVSTPIQPGNSGGPLIDSNGLVVAVATATLGPGVYDRAQNVNFAINGAIVRAFLDAHGIAFLQGVPAGIARDLPDVVEAAAAATALVRCRGAAPPAAMPPRDLLVPASGQSAVDFVIGFNRSWSYDNREALAAMREMYAPQVDFYGETWSRARVLRDKESFAARWPERDYAPDPATLEASCRAQRCTVSGEVQWQARSPSRGATARGRAWFEIGLELRENRFVVVREDGGVLSRD